MTDVAEQPIKPRRGMLGFYIAGLVLVALAVLGARMWTAWDNWQFGEAEAQRRQAEAARQLRVPVETAVDLGDGVKLDLVLIPPGRFRMGSPPEETNRIDGETQHWVMITKAFYVGKYEVTQEQWEKVMGAGRNPSAFKGPKNPVECVSWDECQEFLKRLNGRSKRKETFRLPTEAEWEWACRAGTRTRFCFGDDEARLGEYAWYAANSGNTTHPVGRKQPNAWGLYDMHGNVWEWCGDWCDEYPKSWKTQVDPAGPATGGSRVLRGGSWSYDAGCCRSSSRSRFEPAGRFNVIGFRVVAVPSGL